MRFVSMLSLTFEMVENWGVAPPKKLTWQWKITILNRGHIFKWWVFHCHVSFPGCISFWRFFFIISRKISAFFWVMREQITLATPATQRWLFRCKIRQQNIDSGMVPGCLTSRVNKSKGYTVTPLLQFWFAWWSLKCHRSIWVIW